VIDQTTPNMTFDLETSRQLYPPYTMELVLTEGLVVDRNYTITAIGSNIVGTRSRTINQCKTINNSRVYKTLIPFMKYLNYIRQCLP